ncbi:geranylgeranyl diphosphate synthase IdsB [Nocardia sp. NBC_00565]|uniref:geranylgeranyl diphosphate synthase IdsB n=1 Tax=Nocardia sp. NBC_00565 TaxID=2975993 RepID=UPI003FA5C3EC
MSVTISSATDHSRAGTVLARARDACEPVLRETVGTLPEPLRRMAGYHFGWWDADGIAACADSGKSFRAALVIGAAEAYGLRLGGAVHVAAAVELVHNFSLIHDDVMDADPTRRGRPTVWKVWGTADAILLGETLHALAMPVLISTLPKVMAGAAVTRLAGAVVEMCAGQHEDTAFETRKQVSVEDYARMATGKTAALMGVACALGALCAGADAQTVSAMDTFGRELGLAFQFADDLIGIWGDPAVTGKPVGNDLARRKHSLPVVSALASECDAAVELAALYASETPMTTADVIRATNLVEAAGGRRYAQQQAERRTLVAIETLHGRSDVEDLVALAGTVAHRNR